MREIFEFRNARDLAASAISKFPNNDARVGRIEFPKFPSAAAAANIKGLSYSGTENCR